jgi:ABC-type transport system involved in multi-copper enzyme maturation permease subunit
MTTAVRSATLGGLDALRRRMGRGFAPGITAILVKDLRARMRGRRAFVIMTIHLVLIAGFAWMVQRIAEETIAPQIAFGGVATFASASIGRAIFIGMMVLQTIIVAVLAPASTAGTISGERERQTLDLLAVTPISSFAIVFGKMLGALTWVLVLVLASIPVTALVFLFGGVAPDDVVRGYAVVLATALGLGSVGMFFSALIRRTGAATGLTFVVVLATLLGTIFVWAFFAATGQRDLMTGSIKRPPELLLYPNPFVAQADVACGAEGTIGSWCSLITQITGDEISVVPVPMPADQPAIKGGGIGVGIGGANVRVAAPAPGVVPADVAAPDAQDPSASFRDRFWPKTVATWVLVSIVLTFLSVQLVSPTRRIRLGMPRGSRARRPA